MTAITPTTRKGIYLVIRFLRREDHKNIYLVQCTACGTKREASGNLLRMAEKANSTHCGECQWDGVKPRTAHKVCPQCCDMPWRRPLIHCCKCQMQHEAEVIERPSIQRSSAGALVDNCASSYRVGVRL